MESESRLSVQVKPFSQEEHDAAFHLKIAFPLLYDQSRTANLLGIDQAMLKQLNEAGEISCLDVGSQKLYFGYEITRFYLKILRRLHGGMRIED